MKIGFTLNGAPVCVEAPGTVSLLTLLRDYCRLTGTKRGCDIGECGACTVLLDDRAVTSCDGHGRAGTGPPGGDH